MRHRIVQHAGKRYSLKLDDLVWEALGRIAAEDGLRLNELVAAVARRTAEGSSLTEALRLHCLRRTLERAEALAHQLENQALTASGVPVGLIVESCPAPCFLVSQDHVIRRANAAAEKWIGASAEALTGRSVEHYLQIRSATPLPQVMAAFAQGQPASFPVRLLYLRPGRVVMARAILCPALRDSAESFSYLMMVEPSI
jgi:PAS domain S-box-containing protein